MFDPADFSRALDLVSWIADVHALAETGSTNDDALRLAAGGARHGTVVVADRQTAGRGRSGRSWWSEPGTTLIASVILRPQAPPETWPLIPLACGVAAVRAVRTTCALDVSLKWPNDVERNGRKLGGILVEARPPTAVVAGIGINLSPTIPPDLESTATTVVREGGSMPDRPALLAAILAELHVRILAGDIVEHYRPLCSTLGRRVRVERLGSPPLIGVARSVDKTGALVVEADGRGVAVSAGEITHLRPAPID